MRCLIVGGAGFLGSHLAGRFDNVIVLDNLFTGSKNNIRPTDEFIRHDVRTPYHVECDWIFNLACPASPIHYQRNPIKTINTAVMGAINALELAKEIGARVLQASTSEVYGDPTEHPQKESYWGNVNPIGERSCYDEGKRCAETLFMNYHWQYGVDTRIVRIFNTYGPNMALNDGRVVSNFITQALKHQNLTIYGDGSHTRSFMFVDDLIDGILTVMNSDIYTPVNLGNPVETSMIELATKIIELTDSRSEIEFKPLPSDDPMRRKPDITLAKSLGWEPKISLDEGLKKTIDYFRWL